MAQGTPTLAEAVRALAATLVAAGRTRYELFSIELAEQRSLMAQLAAFAVVGLLALWLMILVATGWVLATFWDTEHRLAAFGWVALFWLIVGLLALWRVVALLRHAPAPFELTRAELARDAQALAPHPSPPPSYGAAPWPVDPAAPQPPAEGPR